MQETRLHQSSRTKLLVVILQLVISHYALVHEIKAGTCKPFLTGKELVIYFRRIRQRSDFFLLIDILN